MRVKRFKMISYADPPQVYFLFFIFSYYYYFSFYRRPAHLPPLSFTIGPTAQRKSTDILEGKTFSLFFFPLHIFYFFNLTDEKMYIKNRHVPDGKSLHTSLYVFRLFLKVNSLFLSSFVLSYFIFFSLFRSACRGFSFSFRTIPALFSISFFSSSSFTRPVPVVLLLDISSNSDFFYPLFQLFLSYFHPLLFASFTRSKLLTLFLTIFENTFGG